ncbi:MAG: hypothetical protein MR769_04655 [Campylobacter sp.]|uniref:hypothetical protein n=1 Tax=Campylobacter sp. TaxID=205 RepID=UPI002AA7D3BF|nr:hypothetical protein [Campylobacter sp.]MCI6343957.1 hypothetical protein [Campylobacter sp.]
MTKAFLVIHSGGNLSKTEVKEQALKELKARFDEYREPCICVVFDKDNKGIYLGIANESGAKIEGFPLFMDIQTLDINKSEQSDTASTAERAEQSDAPSTASEASEASISEPSTANINEASTAEQSSTASTASISTPSTAEQSHAISEQTQQSSVPANSPAIDTSNFALKSELDEFDTQAYKEGVNAFIAEAKKEVVTLGQLDEFDTNAYKQELQTIANEVTNKMAVFDGLSELDLGELKAEIKAQIKDELKAEILAELRG